MQGPILIHRNPPFRGPSQSQFIHEALEKAGPISMPDIAAYVRRAGLPCDVARVKSHIKYWRENYGQDVYLAGPNGWYLNPRGVKYV